jgi:hypothetical protein
VLIQEEPSPRDHGKTPDPKNPIANYLSLDSSFSHSGVSNSVSEDNTVHNRGSKLNQSVPPSMKNSTKFINNLKIGEGMIPEADDESISPNKLSSG